MDRSKLKAPYYAVIFTYKWSKDLEGYQKMDDVTLELAQTMPGFLGFEVSGDGNKQATFISYWKDMESIENWGRNKVHQKAKQKGKTQWYQWCHTQISKVERSSYHELD